jgi:hypothetical protein
MAKIKFGGLAQDARGKIAGIVYSANQFGGYVRAKVSPTQPRTTRQTLVRDRLTTLSKAWASDITDPQRAAWNSFAKLNTTRDVFGNSQAGTGINAYLRVNGVLLNLDEAREDTPPADLMVEGLATVTVTVSAGGGSALIDFTPTPLDADFALYIFATPGLTPGRSFFTPFMRFLVASNPGEATGFDAGPAYIDKFGSMIEGSATGWLIAVADITKGAITTGIFVRAIVGA